MGTKTLATLISLAIVIVLTIGTAFIVRHQAPKPDSAVVQVAGLAPTTPPSLGSALPKVAATLPSVSVPTTSPAAQAPATRPATTPGAAIRPRRPVIAAARPKQQVAVVAPDPVVDEPVMSVPAARAALAAVGVDQEANAFWNLAINDPTLPPNARKDLIEDLNETGFADPKHLTVDDVPMIVNRLAIIEQLAPDAMDDINAAAFQEAYKDLVKMLARLAAQ